MPRVSSASISVRDLAKVYGDVHALRGISFEVAAGEIYGLLGPNGAGKTTAIECILGLREATSGLITIGGLNPAEKPREVRDSVGAQLQTALLQDRLKVREALSLFGSFYPRPLSVDTLLKRFDLLAKADAPFHTLSGGQKQRLFLALAFVNDPRVILFDEPTAGLDPKNRQELHQAIRDFRTEGRAVLLTTHNLDEAEKLCDRIGILFNGRIVVEDTPANLIQRSRCQSRLQFRCAKPVAPASVERLACVTSSVVRGSAITLSTSDSAKTISSLGQCLTEYGNTLLDLQITPPSLEDAFLQITGEIWTDNPAVTDAEAASAK